MKKWIVAAALATLAMNAYAAEKIRFASSATYPPFESLDHDNQIVGFDSVVMMRSSRAWISRQSAANRSISLSRIMQTPRL